MIIRQWLVSAEKKLSKACISTARLDVEVILADALKVDRSWLHAHPESTLSPLLLTKITKKLERRIQHEPVAYIIGFQEFYGRRFRVSPATLTPRPETETLVEKTLEILRSPNKKLQKIADIGTGSGCIIITLALENKGDLSFYGYDVSGDALKVAQQNADHHSASINFIQDDITNNEKHEWQEADLIVANLPYVPSNLPINLAATHEPKQSIYGGDDGLDYYRCMFHHLTHPTYIVTESLPSQHNALHLIAQRRGYSEIDRSDFIQVFKKTN